MYSHDLFRIHYYDKKFIYIFLIKNQLGCMTSKIFALLIFLILSPTITAQSYSTNPTRTQTVGVLCANYQDRTKLISTSDAADVQQYNAAMKASFSVTGTQLFVTLLTTMDPNAILTNYPKLPQEFGLFVGPFVVCLVILCFTCLCSCCCCCCPAGCPPCGCCRKPMGEPYSKCELVWPAIVLLLALGLILAAGVVGLSKSKDIQTTIEAVGCSVSVALDDIINGNTTSTGKFFIGIRTLAKKIDTIKTSLTNVQTQFGTLTGAITSQTLTYGTARTSIDLLPSGTAGGRAPATNYGTPMDGSAAIGNLASTFPTDLGSTSVGDAGTPIFNAYVGLESIHTPLTQTLSQVSSIQSLPTATFNTALDSMKTIVSDIAGKLESGDSNFYSIYSQVTPFFPMILTGATGAYAGLIGISCLGMLATLLLIVCNLYKCRYLLYFTCCILIFIGIVSLFVAILISAFIPIVYFTCDFTTSSFSSAANFNSNLGPVINKFGVGSMASMITVCLNGQSGDFLTGSAISAYTGDLSSMTQSLQNMNNFDISAIQAAVDSVWNPAKLMVEDSYSGKRLDFNSATDTAILNRISDPTANSGCTSPLFASDSWIPSTSPSSTISCKGFSTSATSTQCTSANMQAGSGGCSGCMDAQDLFKNVATIATDLPARYPAPGCSSWLGQLSSVNTRFYSIKQTYYGTGGILNRKITADNDVIAYKTSLSTLGTQFTSVINSLKTSAGTIFDPKYGVLAGLNCALFGQDILLVNNVACTQGFKLLFFIRAAFGIAGFGVLFTMYCASCTGARHFKQQQAKSKSKPSGEQINQTRQDLKQTKQLDNTNQRINETMHKNNNYMDNNAKGANQQNKYLEKDYATVYQNQLSYK